MKPNPQFVTHGNTFWAFVRTISEEVGYTAKGKDEVRVPTLEEMAAALTGLDLDSSSLFENGVATALGTKLLQYFEHRASALNSIKSQLMTLDEARQVFDDVCKKCPYLCHLPKNKQKKEKATPAYLTCTIVMLLEEALETLTPLKTLPVVADESDARSNWLTIAELKQLHLGSNNHVKKLIVEGQIRTGRRGRFKVFHPGDVQRLKPHCDYDPRTLTTVTLNRRPFRTLARRVDGAYPKPVNPVAIWEIKEYYHTTSFGSRVADGIYETLLDGAELEDLNKQGHVVRHYLFVDGFETWWQDGKSYLCRIFDSLHMGYLDEAIFGRELVKRLPDLAREWVRENKARIQQETAPVGR